MLEARKLDLIIYTAKECGFDLSYEDAEQILIDFNKEY